MKVKQFGDNFYLKPYQGMSTLGEGMYTKNGGNYEIAQDITMKDIPHLAAIIGLLA